MAQGPAIVLVRAAPYQQLKIPEGSKAVNVREATFINGVILCVCTGRVAISVCSLSCCRIT